MNFKEIAKDSVVKEPAKRQGTLPGGQAPRNRSVPFRIEGIEYKGEISLEQIIACKKRARKVYSKSLTVITSDQPSESPTASTLKEFTADFYDSIEAFLDKENVFIVSPTPTKELKSYLKLSKTNSQTKYNKIDSMDQGLQYKDPDLDTTDYDCWSLAMDKIKSEPICTSSLKKPQDGPFLGKIAASSLMQKRKKFDTYDYIAPTKEQAV